MGRLKRLEPFPRLQEFQETHRRTTVSKRVTTTRANDKRCNYGLVFLIYHRPYIQTRNPCRNYQSPCDITKVFVYGTG